MAPILIFLGVLFLIIGVVYIAIKVPQIIAQDKRRTEQAAGIISKAVKKLRRRGTTQKYTYDFSYTVDGEPYELKRITTYKKFEQGDELQISYNPEKPGDAHVDEFHLSPDVARKVSYTFLIAGAVCLLIGVIVLLIK